MRGAARMLIQSAFNRFGLQVRRVERGVSYTDPYVEQARLLGRDSVEVVFEVGAANGRDCLRYADLFDRARVIAFEPLPQSFAKLGAIARGRIEAHNLALCGSRGTALFNVAHWDDASSLLIPNATGSTYDGYNETRETIQIKTDTLEDFCKEKGIRRIDLLKMDAQGAELSILKAAGPVLQTIRLIYTEVNFLDNWKQVSRFEDILTFLSAAGFRLHNFYNMTSNQRGQLAWADAIFMRTAST